MLRYRGLVDTQEGGDFALAETLEIVEGQAFVLRVLASSIYKKSGEIVQISPEKIAGGQTGYISHQLPNMDSRSNSC
jgi:hypothetical protein